MKVEDLVIVYRWLELNRVPQSYCQVFFDSVFAIDFSGHFRDDCLLGRVFDPGSTAKSQEKATIMIPITCGRQVR